MSNGIKHYLKLAEQFKPDLTVFRTDSFDLVTIGMYSDGFSVQRSFDVDGIDALINALDVARTELIEGVKIV